MTFTEAALLVLRLAGKPLHYKEITDIAIEKSLLSHVGKSPEVTMGARLASQVKSVEKDNPLKRVKPGVFALGEWDDKKIEDGLADRTPALERIKQAEAELEAAKHVDAPVEAAPVEEEPEPQQTAAAHRALDDAATPPDEDEQRRAELSANAIALFESEDDDDQPILGAPAKEVADDDAADDKADNKRRRRRRRGRGRRDDEVSLDEDSDDLPGYTVSDAEPEDVLSAEEFGAALEESSEPAGPGLAEQLAAVMGKFNGSRGAVGAQSVADSLRKKLKSDSGLNGAAVIAIAIADNLAMERRGAPPRFRVAGNQLALTEWSYDRRYNERQQELLKAADHVQKATLKALSEEIKRLPQRAVGELVQILLERMGVTQLSSVRRPGGHGSELHFSGVLGAAGAVKIPVAIMVRRDGRDIGRERVTELRGAMHHYGQASAGWLISTGQVLSGAREEAHASGASPVTLTGRSELAELFLAHGIGVRTHRIEVPVIDAQLFEGLSGR